MAGHLLFLNEEIYLHPFFGIFRRLAIEEQFVACGSQHLRYDILHEHSFVHFQLTKQKFLVDFRRDNASVSQKKLHIATLFNKNMLMTMKKPQLARAS